MAVAALGDCQGPLGGSALRSLLLTPDETQDLHYAAIIALAKREGAKASEVFDWWLRNGTPDQRRAAMIALAGVGDDRAWEYTFQRLRRVLANVAEPNSRPASAPIATSRLTMEISYLWRHLSGGAGEPRAPRLPALLRTRWNSLNQAERNWLTAHWPGVDPALPAETLDHPDPDQLATWAKTPILNRPALG